MTVPPNRCCEVTAHPVRLQTNLRCEIHISFLSLEIMSQVSSRTFCFPERTVPCSWKGSLTHHGSSAVKEINPLRSSCKICEPFLDTSQCGSKSGSLLLCYIQRATATFNVPIPRWCPQTSCRTRKWEGFHLSVMLFRLEVFILIDSKLYKELLMLEKDQQLSEEKRDV